jgi:MFS family permease
MVLQKMDVEYAVTIAALPASLVVLVAGYLGSRYEHKPLMYAFMLSCVGACAYFTFKVSYSIARLEANGILLMHLFMTLAVPNR